MNIKRHILTHRNKLLISILALIITPILCVSQNQPYTIKTVVIDAGHGGKDPGAIGKNAREKDITLQLALKTGALIEKNYPNVKVIYTRKTDVFIELHQRAEIANKNNADLFISIHVNANANSEASGTDSWIMGLHKSKANLEVAKLENKVISVEENNSTKYEGMSPDDTEAIIIHTMMQSANLEHSATLASLVQNQFRERVGRKDRGVKSAPFLVLWKTTMPSILIESGFISNLEEEAFLTSAQGQDYMSSAIYRAFKEYKTLIERKTNFDADTLAQRESAIHSANTIETASQNVSIADDAIIYSIQIAASKNKTNTNSSNFKGIDNVFFIQENNLYKYLVGKETTFNDIKKLHESIKSSYPNSFIIATKNGVKMNLQEARKITQ